MTPTNGNDIITVGVVTEIVDALAGDDLIRVLAGGATDHTLEGNTGTDEVRFIFDGTDQAISAQNMAITGFETLGLEWDSASSGSPGTVTFDDDQFTFSTVNFDAGQTRGLQVNVLIDGAVTRDFSNITASSYTAGKDDFFFFADNDAQIITGTDYDDTFDTADGNDRINAGAGDDTIFGQGGDDIINPGTGEDVILGGSGVDAVTYFDSAHAISARLDLGEITVNGEVDQISSIENVTASVFADYFITDAADNRIRTLGDYDWVVGSDGNDYYDGGTGQDMISYQNASSGVIVSLEQGRGLGGQANGDRYVSVERVTGSSFVDTLYGSEGSEDLRGLGGYDNFFAMGNASGTDKDRFYGGDGLDTVSYIQATSAVEASLLLGRGISGWASRDLYFDIENLNGSNFNDTLTGDNGRNQIVGFSGNDDINANGGVDRITGGSGNDDIDGGSGYDYSFYLGAQADYTITTNGNTTTVTANANNDGVDTLTNIEELVFSDGSLLI
jgi:Ca2+-binding RTX toxin-like protein